MRIAAPKPNKPTKLLTVPSADEQVKHLAGTEHGRATVEDGLMGP